MAAFNPISALLEALVNLAGLMPSVMVFVVAMGAGMILKDLWDRRVLSGTPVRDDTQSPSTDGKLDTTRAT